MSQTTAVFVTHDQEEALSMCDSVAVMVQGSLEQLDTPEGLYQTPKSKFVADFVTQANFLPASWSLDRWKTEIGSFNDDRQSESVGNASRNGNRPQLDRNRQANVMIRQESLQLIPDETSQIVIRDRQFLGREYRYWLVTPSGQNLYARTSIGVDLVAGTKVRLSVPDDEAQVFAID